MSKPLPLMIVACAVALLGCAKPAPPSLSAFDGFVADFAREIAADSPERATRFGLSEAEAGRGFQRALDDRSAEAQQVRRNIWLRRAAQFRQFDRAALDAEDRLTYDILKRVLADAEGGARFAFGRFESDGVFSPYALNQMDSAFLALPDFFDTQVPAGTLAQARAYVARLRLVAAAIDAETERAKADAAAGYAPPLFIVDRTLAAAERAYGTPANQQPYATALRRNLEAAFGPLAQAEAPAPAPPSKEPNASERDRAQAISLYASAVEITSTQIQPAQARAAAALRTLREKAGAEAGVWRLPDGAAYYRAALRAQTTTDLTPEQIYNMGALRVAALTQELDGALRVEGLTDGAVGQRLSILTRDPKHQYAPTEEGRAQLLADVKARVARMMTESEKQFSALPKAPLEVRAVPPLLEASAPGPYYEGPSLDGAKPGIYYVNLRDLAQMTKIDLPTQDYHEAVPGHHFQTALAQEQKQLPLFRRIQDVNAYAEGWALYAEQLADEIGSYENDRIGRIGYLRWQLWRAARLVVDTGLHDKRWTREQAIQYLLDTTGDHPDVIISEVERYAAWPGQACGYELGRAEIVRLREQAKRDLGAAFQARSFHTVILGAGAVPLPVLETVIQDWAERAGARGGR
jgi:uncharacterized protein (DUF885 family)